MLFTGPTGTGKTELATAIAEYLYGDQSRLVRVDMGEMSGPDAVARLIGDPWNPEGLLTSRVRSQPFCVVLLDEIEKAHPRALHLLLQLFDEGRLTDAAGEVASFASAVVIMTSNLGSRNAQPIGFGDIRDRILADVAKAVREFFPVELFNRIDQVVPFEPLTPEVAAKVVDKELGKLLARRGLRERNTFVYAGSAVRRRAVTDAFDPRYGARTVKRWLEDKIGGSLTDLLATRFAGAAADRAARRGRRRDPGDARADARARRRCPAPYVLEGALDLATAGARAAIARAAAAVACVRDSRSARARARAKRPASCATTSTSSRSGSTRSISCSASCRSASPSRTDEDDDDRPAPRSATRQAREEEDRAHAGEPRGADRRHRRGAADRARAADAARSRRARRRPSSMSRVGASIEAGGIFAVVHTLAQPAWLDEAAFVDDRSGAGQADAEGPSAS